jgi:prepilin-type N-terminal cleavage/methylation domain-containing protein
MMKTRLISRGFTLIELMVTVAIIAIIALVAVPSMTAMIETRRMQSATEFVYARVAAARVEAIKQSKTVYVTFATGNAGTWSIGMSDKTSCQPATTPADCTVSTMVNGVPDTDLSYVFSGADHARVNLTSAAFGSPASTQASFTAGRGTSNGGTVTLTSTDGLQTQVQVNALGRVIICSPTGTGKVGAYRDC